MTSNKPNLKRSILKRPGAKYFWALTGGIVGLLYHSSVGYVYRSLMFRPRLESPFSIVDIIFEEITRAFSLLTLLILDLDNFKQYKDTFGYLAGDGVTAKTGKIIRESIRSTDTAYRYGEEEFAILLKYKFKNSAA